MTANTASCRCGQLSATAEGDPVRVSICHCLACQKRSGSAFSAQARWELDCVTFGGESRQWVRTADSGQQTTYHFCPNCGSTVYYGGGNFPELVALPIGTLEDPYVGCIDYSVWERRMHPWVQLLGENIEHRD